MASSVHAKVISVKISSSAEGNAQCSSLQDLISLQDNMSNAKMISNREK